MFIYLSLCIVLKLGLSHSRKNWKRSQSRSSPATRSRLAIHRSKVELIEMSENLFRIRHISPENGTRKVQTAQYEMI